MYHDLIVIRMISTLFKISQILKFIFKTDSS